MELSEEERERRRQQALALHKEGRFGGAQPGSGRPRKKRASEIVAEQVASEGQAIFDRLMTIVRDGTDSNAISASRELLSIENAEAQRQDQEEEKIDTLHRDQLLSMVTGTLQELMDRGIIPEVGTILDGDFVEVADERVATVGEIPASTD